MVVQMISVGEETGALDKMLDKIAAFYDDEVNVAVDTLTSIIEPIMIVVMGSGRGRHGGRHVPADVQARLGGGRWRLGGLRPFRTRIWATGG